MNGHDKEYECLRAIFCDLDTWKGIDLKNNNNNDNDSEEECYLVASAGADGVIKLWKVTRIEYECICTIKTYATTDDNEQAETPQVYALDFINWSFAGQDNYLILTSADDYIHLWEVVENEEKKSHELIKVLSFHFIHYINFNHGISMIYP